MTSRRWQVVAGWATLAAGLWTGQAQVNPRIGYVHPAGGQQGATFQVTLGGQFLDGATNVYVSGAGVQATVLEHTKPLTQRQLNDLREKLRELQEKRRLASTNAAPGTNWTAVDERTVAEIRGKLAKAPRRQANPAIAETVTLNVALAPDAPPGERELRLGTAAGLSNPLVFCVGELAEFRELEEREATTGPAMRVTLPAVINGQILPGDVDRFRLEARRGERLVVRAAARELIPYLPDAVPGWFQATLALYSEDGKEVAYDDDYRFHPDPVFSYTVPQDGEYVLEIKDALYRGREDFVYRIAAGELPFVTSIFPLGGRAGAPATVELTGWNLPTSKLTLDTQGWAPGVHWLSVPSGPRRSNLVPFALDTLADVPEHEPNSQPGRAQRLAPPVIVNGRIDQPGDWDVFRFQGQAGSQIVAEVQARRLSSPLDSTLKLTDAAGRQLTASDDYEDQGAGLITHHADSWLCATLPAKGTYYLYLSDAQHQGGAEYAYRLRVSPPQPDFELRLAPSSINARGGATLPLTVYAVRRDGFTNEITLVLKDAPPGFTLSGGRLPAQQDQVRLTLTVPATPQPEPYSLCLEGRALIQGREVVRPVVPAEDMMQAFSYHHLVPAKELRVAVVGRGRPNAPAKLLGETPVRIPAGGTARVEVGLPAGPFARALQFELSDPPEGIVIQEVAPTRAGAEILLHTDGAKAKPGQKGNLIVTAFAGPTGPAGRAAEARNRRRAPMGILPAIPFEIVEAKPAD
jgi:hypothetical protein